jgi:antitoxin MazE
LYILRAREERAMQVIVSKWGNSLGLRLPKALAAEVGVADGQVVEVRAEKGRLVIEPARKTYSLEQMMENVTPEAMREAWDWGPDVGREIVDD